MASMMTPEELAEYLCMDLAEVRRRARSGALPAVPRGDSWRFSKEEIDHWLESQVPHFPRESLSRLEGGAAFAVRREAAPETLLPALITPVAILLDGAAKTRASVLHELVEVLERSGRLIDPDSILAAVREREDMMSTALGRGVAIPHPRERIPWAVTEDSLAVVRTVRGVPFGAMDGGLTDLFFLLVCQEDRRHLRILARLSRILQKEESLADLRAAADPDEVRDLLVHKERELLSVLHG